MCDIDHVCVFDGRAHAVPYDSEPHAVRRALRRLGPLYVGQVGDSWHMRGPWGLGTRLCLDVGAARYAHVVVVACIGGHNRGVGVCQVASSLLPSLQGVHVRCQKRPVACLRACNSCILKKYKKKRITNPGSA